MIRIGIICPSEIAFRRFMPSLQKLNNIFEFCGIAFADPEEWFGNLDEIKKENILTQQNREFEKAKTFIDAFGGKIYKSYSSLVNSPDIHAIYIPLPPSLHYEWAKLALNSGKHVFLEKPATSCSSDTADLIKIASEKNLALHENYMFIFHNQIKEIQDIISTGEIGDIRLYRLTFGFPRRSKNDFRYNKALGGGSLLDAGGYAIKYATYLLGTTSKITTAQLNYNEEFVVDLYGSATMVNDFGITVQLAFGMDNDYKCDIEICGSDGTLTSNRIFTAPTGIEPSYVIKKNQVYTTHSLSSDDAFQKSLNHFYKCINDKFERENNFLIIQRQADLVTQFINKATNKNNL